MHIEQEYVDGILVAHKVDGVDRLSSNSVVATWPLALLPLKLLAQPGDRGAGDIIARTIGPIGGDAFKVWYKRIFGKSCGCGKRQEELNQRWPIS